MAEFVPVATVDESSGRIHIRVQERRADGTVRRTLSDERCQTDESGGYTVAPFPVDDDLMVTLREGEGRPMACLFCVPADPNE